MSHLLQKWEVVKTRLRVLRAGFGSALADKFLTESVRILAERFTVGACTPPELNHSTFNQKYFYYTLLIVFLIRFF